jgi:hypothetical protein
MPDPILPASPVTRAALAGVPVWVLKPRSVGVTTSLYARAPDDYLHAMCSALAMEKQNG